ncbi:Os06g0476150 [Oryza sativa Japonica Group]|uniref:Os06g0476150 protein n=1 Tax=Oryza sativa subsp. japonica TaxID=39947 RepID=A0A0N7KM43_ORYSJ|nr:hypothetical protein EE612_034146 [Oryza sativa]BAS97777.1 Os06g0476150 [Oryza sativa Japonica Group]
MCQQNKKPWPYGPAHLQLCSSFLASMHGAAVAQPHLLHVVRFHPRRPMPRPLVPLHQLRPLTRYHAAGLLPEQDALLSWCLCSPRLQDDPGAAPAPATDLLPATPPSSAANAEFLTWSMAGAAGNL